MKICIYGAGAIGGLIGGYLVREDHDVSLIARGAHLSALKADGLTVETPDGTRFTAACAASDEPADLGPQDVVFVAVKNPSLPDVAAGIAPLLGPETAVVTAMNGLPWWFFDGFPVAGPAIDIPALDPGGTISAAIATDRVVGCVIHMGAAVPAPGSARHMGGGLLIFGETTGLVSDRVRAIADMFGPTPLETKLTDDLRLEIWLKLLGNFNFGPISALTDATNGAIGADPALRKLANDLFEEAAEAGRRVGLVPDMTADARTDLGAQLGDFKTSMLQDFEGGKTPEIDAIVAAPVALGHAVGVPMPVSEAVLALVRAKAAGIS
jgi:2-dehydropantoate 2-reductase